MFNFPLLLAGLRAVIAARAARDRSLQALLVALYARLARMGNRLDRLIAQWRAGTLSPPRAPRSASARAPRQTAKIRIPNSQGWLLRKLGYQVAVYGSQLQHALTAPECAAFLAACPQAGRIFRPLLRMLTADPPPKILCLVRAAIAPVAALLPLPDGVIAAPGSQKLDGQV